MVISGAFELYKSYNVRDSEFTTTIFCAIQVPFGESKDKPNIPLNLILLLLCLIMHIFMIKYVKEIEHTVAVNAEGEWSLVKV